MFRLVFQEKKLCLGSCQQLKNRKEKSVAKVKCLRNVLWNSIKMCFCGNWNCWKIKEMFGGRTSNWGSTKNTFCVFEKFPKSFFVTFEALHAKKMEIFRFFSSFSLFIFGRPPSAGMGGPLTPSQMIFHQNDRIWEKIL